MVLCFPFARLWQPVNKMSSTKYIQTWCPLMFYGSLRAPPPNICFCHLFRKKLHVMVFKILFDFFSGCLGPESFTAIILQGFKREKEAYVLFTAQPNKVGWSLHTHTHAHNWKLLGVGWRGNYLYGICTPLQAVVILAPGPPGTRATKSWPLDCQKVISGFHQKLEVAFFLDLKEGHQKPFSPKTRLLGLPVTQKRCF